MGVGKKIKQFRKVFLRMTQLDFSKKFKISQQRLSLIEKEYRKVPLSLLKEIMKFSEQKKFNVTTDWWLKS